MKFLIVAIVMLATFSASATTLEEIKVLIKNGQYKAAKIELLTFKACSTSKFDQAMALKNLGTVKQKLDEPLQEWKACFDQSITLLSGDLSKFPKALSVVYFQKANCLVNSAFSSIRSKSISGLTPPMLFETIRHYVNPASVALCEAKKNYPREEMADLTLLQSDITFIVQLLTGRENSPHDDQVLLTLYDKAYRQEVENNATPRQDVLISILLKQVTIYRYEKRYKEAETLCLKALKMKPNNSELKLEAQLHYMAVKLMQPLRKKDFARFEKVLLKCVKRVETLRNQNIEPRSYFGASAYFSRRTVVYELLLDFYNHFGRTDKMLMAIGQMKARAFKETVMASTYKPLDLQKVQANLRDSQAWAVEYFVGQKKSWMIIIKPDTLIARQIALPGHKLFSLVKAVLRGYTDLSLLRCYRRQPNDPKYEALRQCFQSSHKLYSHLLGPLTLERGQPKRLYLIPHHIVNYLPMAALVTSVDQENLLNSQYFLQTAPPMSYLPTLSLLAQRTNLKLGLKSKIFYRSNFTKKPVTNFEDLPATKTEAKKVREILSAELFGEQKLNRQNLLQPNVETDVIYIATHARLMAQRPESSFLQLRGSGPASHLTVKELISKYTNKLHTNLTVLSACQTNRGELNPLPGDDISALSRAFLIAGSKAVISTQWEVADSYTSKIFQQMMRNYQRGQPTAIALDNALKKHLKDSSHTLLSHPFFWANLILLESAYITSTSM